MSANDLFIFYFFFQLKTELKHEKLFDVCQTVQMFQWPNWSKFEGTIWRKFLSQAIFPRTNIIVLRLCWIQLSRTLQYNWCGTIYFVRILNDATIANRNSIFNTDFNYILNSQDEFVAILCRIIVCFCAKFARFSYQSRNHSAILPHEHWPIVRFLLALAPNGMPMW